MYVLDVLYGCRGILPNCVCIVLISAVRHKNRPSTKYTQKLVQLLLNGFSIHNPSSHSVFCIFASGNLSTEPKVQGGRAGIPLEAFLLHLPNKLNFEIGLGFFGHQWKWIKNKQKRRIFRKYEYCNTQFSRQKKEWIAPRKKSWHRKIWWWKILYRRNWEEDTIWTEWREIE